ncbi:PAS domain S-box protein [Patescibacteria group bacterium]|nr:PAS domain S-box protein [Patescibacteria group bacterium]
MEIKEKNKEENKISILLEDLASLESYASDLFSFLPLPVCLISSIGIILEANPALERISGYKIEEIIGKPVENLFIKEEIEILSKDTIEKGFVKGKEINIFTKEKRKVPVSASTVLRKSEEGEIIGYFIGFFDLIDIKKKEGELKNAQTALLNMLEDTEKERERVEEEKNKTLAIITNFADGLLVFDKENNLLLINPQAEDFFEIKAKKIVGKSISKIAKFSPFKSLINLFGEEIKKIFRKELSLGKNLVLEITTTPFIREKEKLGTLVILHDITREKLIERMKTEFVSLSAHQLRTPLSAIKWTLRMLLDGDLGEITKEQRDFLKKTYRSNERMINLINDLLNVARIEEGRYIYRPIFANIEEIVRSVINSFNEEIERKNIKFEFKKLEKKLPKILIDTEKMKVVIENLLDNAIRYTFPGGQVTVSLKYAKKEIEFSIEDTGVGIPEDQQERVFTKFFRAANVMRMETEGTGLGLFTTKNIIEAHGGKIWFESKENKGTTFYFTLPVKEKFKKFLEEL